MGDQPPTPTPGSYQRPGDGRRVMRRVQDMATTPAGRWTAIIGAVVTALYTAMTTPGTEDVAHVRDANARLAGAVLDELDLMSRVMRRQERELRRLQRRLDRIERTDWTALVLGITGDADEGAAPRPPDDPLPTYRDAAPERRGGGWRDDDDGSLDHDTRPGVEVLREIQRDVSP